MIRNITTIGVRIRNVTIVGLRIRNITSAEVGDNEYNNSRSGG